MDIQRIMEVQGSHRTLFYRPSRKQVSTVVVDLDGNSKKINTEKKGKKSSVVITLPAKGEKMATKGTQTDYRESEAQTFPWRHQIQTGGELLSELLSLDWFTSEGNFPLGLKEVMLIEETRQRLAWEKIIEKLKGKENQNRRRSLVQRMSAHDAALKEKRKEEENKERIENSRKQIQEAQKLFQEELSSRLQRSYVTRKMENSTKINYWNHQLARKIRKVKSAKSVLSVKPDIIALHKDKASDLYAPKLRDGDSPSLRHEVIDIQCRFLKRYHGLEILEKHLANVLHPKWPKTQKSKLSFTKFSEIEDKTSDNLKVPVPTPEVDTTSRTELQSDD